MVNPAKIADTAEVPAASDSSDFAWGAAAIAREIGRSESQVYAMIAAGLLDGAVRKLSHKRLVASRRALHRVLLHAE